MSDALAHLSSLFRVVQTGQKPAPDALDAYIRDGQIQVPDGLSPSQQATFVWHAGDVARAIGKNGPAVGAFQTLVALEKAAGEPPIGLAYSYARLCGALAAEGRLEEAHQAVAEGVALLGEPPRAAPWFHAQVARALSEAEDYGRAGPHWQRAYTQYRAEGDAKRAGEVRMSMAYDLLQMARNTYSRGDVAMQAGAAEAVLAELADQFLAMTVTANKIVDEMLSDPELLPHTAQARVYFRIELSHAYSVMGRPEEAIAQLKTIVDHPDTSLADRAVCRERIAELTEG